MERPLASGRQAGTALETFDLSAAIYVRRQELGLTQAALAERLQVNTWTVIGWESGTRIPMDRFYPGLICFLGREPWPPPRTMGERLGAERLRRGLSQVQAAAIIQVDPGSIAAWESGRKPRHRLSWAKVTAFVEGGVRPWRAGRSPTGSGRKMRL